MKILFPVASGKGGVGKSIFVANLGVCLASHGKTTILVDLDLGGSNLHTCLGITNKNPGIGSLIYKKETSIESLVVPTGIDRLFFIPGDLLLPGTANLGYFIKKKIIRGINKLVADYVILDLGSSSSFNTVDFFLSSSSGIIITTPETTAILNAYSFLKTTLFRLIYRSFPPRSREREIILEFITERIEGSDSSFAELIEILSDLDQSSGEIGQQKLSELYPRIVINMGNNDRDLKVGVKLRQIVRRNLGIELEYIGFLYKDKIVPLSIIKRKPGFLLEPSSRFVRSIDLVAQKILSIQIPSTPKLYEKDEDLNELQKELM